MIDASKDADRVGKEDCAGAEFILELPSDLNVIEAAVDYVVSRCRACSFEGPQIDLNLRVSVSEALANAVLYGNENDPEKTVRVEVHIAPGCVEILVADEGDGFDPDAVPDPTRPENRQATGGRGLFLIRELMDRADYNERGNVVRMVLTRGDGRQRR